MNFNVLEGDSVAQLAHIGWGAALMFTLAHGLPYVASMMIVAGSMFLKEALEALGVAPWEPKQTWSSSMVDFAFFVVGIAWAAVVLR
jgi:hypothetical protein